MLASFFLKLDRFRFFVGGCDWVWLGWAWVWLDWDWDWCVVVGCPYCSEPSVAFLLVFRPFSSGTIAWGFSVNRGFQGVVGKLSGCTSKEAWGFVMFAFRWFGCRADADLVFLGGG